MALTPTRRTYPQLGLQSDVQDADLLASYRGIGPLKRVTATTLKTYFQTGVALSSVLAASSGAGLIGCIETGTGAVLRTLQAALRDTVSVKDYGAVGDGVTNDTPFIQAAIDALGVKGGNVFIPNDMKCLIDTALTLKKSVSLVGPHKMIGSPGSNSSAPYGDLGGCLIVNSAVTITTQSGSTVQGILFYRKGMTFPATSSAAFAGTCLTNTGDDVSVFQCMFLGFDMAFSSVGTVGAGGYLNRMRLHDINMDCQNGIYVEACYDNPYISDVHSWPFATIAASVAHPTTWYQRTGTAYHFKDIADWLSLNNCFSYNHAIGTHLEAVNSYVLNSPAHDGFSKPGAIGVEAGTWNATTNTPTLTSSVISPASGISYPFYTVSVAGSTTLDTISSWAVGDKVFWNGSVWTKLAPGVIPTIDWNATTNTPTLASGVNPVAGAAYPYFTVSVAGSTTLNGNTGWLVGEKVFWTGSAWTKVPLQTTPIANLNVNGIGILIDGTRGGCEHGQIVTPRIASQGDAGIRVKTYFGTTTNIIGGTVWACAKNAIHHDALVTDVGTWDATTNTPTLVSSVNALASDVTFPYYTVSVAGSTTINGNTGWLVGEKILWTGAAWTKVAVGVTPVVGGAGNLTINGTLLQNCAVGIKIDSATGQSNRIGVHFDNIGQPVLATVSKNNIYGTQDISNQNAGADLITANGNAVCENVAIGGTPPNAFVSLPANGQIFNITNAVDFGTLGPGWKDREVTLIFSGAATVFAGIGSSNVMLLSGGLNFVTQAGSTLTLRHNGVQWYEIARSGATFNTTPTVASADPLPLTGNSSAYNVTGTTSFGTIASGVDGREVTLIFDGILTVFSATTSAPAEVRLAGGVNFTTAVGSTLTIRHNGVRWYEIGRSA